MEEDMQIYNCLLCKRLEGKDDGNFKCPAFPEGIPEEKLIDSEPDNRQKECANGVKFEEE